MRRLVSMMMIIGLALILTACDDQISLVGDYTATTDDYSINMTFDDQSKLLTLDDDGKKMTSQYTIDADQLVLDNIPTYQIDKINDEQYKLYKITDEGVSKEVAYVLKSTNSSQ